jgi:AcrR family transcriptional regulator
MTVQRRMGAQDSKTRALLLEVTAQVMIEDGYAAATSRRVAAKAGVKPALVHYYFQTMDDLFLALFRSEAEAGLTRYEQALASERPLRAVWALSSDPGSARLVAEFHALSNHRKVISAEIAAFGERFRVMQVKALRGILADAGETTVEPEAVAFLAAAISVVYSKEVELGITTGHSEVMALVDRFLDRLEPLPPTA